MAKQIEIVAKNEEKATVEMSDEQTTFVPHWLFRTTNDFVADVSVVAKTKGIVVNTRDDFISLLVASVNSHLGTELVADDYDFGGKYNRANPQPEPKARGRTAKADNSSNISAYVDAIKTALDKKQTEIAANPETKPVTIKALRGFIKSGYGLSEQTVDTIMLDAVVRNHPAIEKIELSL